PAVDVAGRAQDHPPRVGEAARPGRRRPLQAGSAEALGFKIRIHFARNRIMLGPVGTGFTFRFREWLRRSDEGLKKIQADRRPSASPSRWPSFPAVNVRSGRAALTRASRRSIAGEETRWP